MKSTAMRVVVSLVAAAVGFRVVRVLLAPATICAVVGDNPASYTCPNRFGFSLPSPLILGLTIAAAVVVGTAGWFLSAPRDS